MLATVSRRKAVDAHYDLLCGMGLFHASVLETDKRKTAFDSMLSKDSATYEKALRADRFVKV
jgi:hypothetical protein